MFSSGIYANNNTNNNAPNSQGCGELVKGGNLGRALSCALWPAECSLNISCMEKVVTSLHLDLAPFWADLVSQLVMHERQAGLLALLLAFWTTVTLLIYRIKDFLFFFGCAFGNIYSHCFHCIGPSPHFPLESPLLSVYLQLTNILILLWFRDGNFSALC